MTDQPRFVLAAFSVALAIATGSAARADEPPAAASPAAETPDAPADPKVRVTVFSLPHAGVDESRMVEVLRSVENGLKKNERLEMKDLDSRLADFAQETPTDQIEAARTLAKEGMQALSELKIPEAVQKLSDAETGLAKVLPYIKKQELADVQAALGVAYYEGGDKQSGYDEFVSLATWRPDYMYDTQKLAAKHAAQFDEALHLVDKAKRAPIAITSTPAGAQAYVDGKYIGVTPCSTEPLPVGQHFVTLKKEGFKKAVQPVAVQKKGEAKAEVALDRNEKYLLVEQARSKVEQTMGADLIDAESETLKTVLFIDQAVFVRAAPQAGSPGKLAVEAYLYDLRTRHRLSKVQKVAEAGAVEASVVPVAQNLYTDVSYGGELAAPVEKVPERAKPKPAYKTWWFWTAIGAGAVLAGGAVGAYFAIEATRPATCADGVTCFQFGP